MGKRKVEQHSSGDQVRAWAVEQGLEVATTRGRLPNGVIADYNAAHPDATYAPKSAQGAKTVSIQSVGLTNAKGHKRTKTFTPTITEVRALVGAPAQGRLSKAHLAQAAEILSQREQQGGSPATQATPDVQA